MMSLAFIEYIGLFFMCGVPIVLLVGGFLIGTLIEQSHLNRLDAAERELMTIPVTDLKTIPPGVEAGGARLVAGNVVIASDYFRTFSSSLRKLIGGEMGFYEKIMFRARREAVCRMMQQAHSLGAKAVINVRLEASNIAGMTKKASPMIEVIAYGTAVLPKGN
jgi:uncharacterized protein YbjQ (UPF0145 family)